MKSRCLPLLAAVLLVAGCGKNPDRNVDPVHLSFDDQGVGRLTLQGEIFGDEFGKSIIWTTDVNGDGFPDILVGAPAAAGGGIERGEVYIFFGGPIMDNISDAVILGERDFDHFGVALADAGDMDGDGFGDFWVSAPDTLNDGQVRSNAVYLFRGGPFLAGTLSAAVGAVKVSRGGSGSGFGISLATLDVDGDGKRDLLVGAPFNDIGVGLVRSGIVYLYTQFSNGFGTPIPLPGPKSSGLFGYSIANLGDINGDQKEDFVVGAPTTPSLNENGTPTGKGCTDSGDVYLFFGRVGTGYPAQGDRLMSGQLSSTTVGECFGFSVAGGGDLDGDGVPDLAVGAPRTTNGAVYLFRGAALRDGAVPPALVAAAQIVSGETNGEFFGTALGGFVDRSGDGKADISIGAYNRDQVGAVDLFDGGIPLGPKATSFLGSIQKGYFGLTLGAGKVGGRGLLIGAPIGGTGTVQIYVFGQF